MQIMVQDRWKCIQIQDSNINRWKRCKLIILRYFFQLSVDWILSVLHIMGFFFSFFFSIVMGTTISYNGHRMKPWLNYSFTVLHCSWLNQIRDCKRPASISAVLDISGERQKIEAAWHCSNVMCTWHVW